MQQVVEDGAATQPQYEKFLFVGLSSFQVRMIMGEPGSIDTKTENGKVFQRWLYGGAQKKYLYFQDDKLVKWEFPKGYSYIENKENTPPSKDLQPAIPAARQGDSTTAPLSD